MKFGRSLLFVAIFATFATLSFSAKAVEDGEECFIMYPVEKLGRGIANAGFGCLELFIRMWEVQQDKGGISGITYGVLKGVCYTVAREVVGVVDVATFLFPLPGCPNIPGGCGWGYGPIMRPAWVVDVDNDWNNFVYDRDAVVNSTR